MREKKKNSLRTKKTFKYHQTTPIQASTKLTWREQKDMKQRATEIATLLLCDGMIYDVINLTWETSASPAETRSISDSKRRTLSKYMESFAALKEKQRTDSAKPDQTEITHKHTNTHNAENRNRSSQ